MTKCRICKVNEQDWSWQPFGPDEEGLSFTMPGWHYRSFPVIPVCQSCKEKLQQGDRVEFTYKEKRYVVNGVDEMAGHSVRYVVDPNEAAPKQLVHMVVGYEPEWSVSECSRDVYGGWWREASTQGLHMWQVCGDCCKGFARLCEDRQRQMKYHKPRELEKVRA